MKPPYPTELNPYDDGNETIEDSISYWLKPRKVSEHPPEFPCLSFLDGVGWITYTPINESKITHWLPLPPGPSNE